MSDGLFDRLPPQWETARLFVRDVVEDDVGTLHALFNANVDIGRWDPTFTPVPAAEIRALVRRSLEGYNADGSRFQMQCLEMKPEALCQIGEPRVGLNGVVGYFHCSYGAPQPDMIWVSIFVMHPTARQMGYAQEALRGMQYIWPLLEGGQTRACARVWVKNWPAMRFWLGAGFDRVLQWDGARELAEDAYASVVLEWRWQAGAPPRTTGALINRPVSV